MLRRGIVCPVIQIDSTIMSIQTIFVPYFHRSVSQHQIIAAFEKAFDQHIVSRVKLITQTGDDGLTYQIGFIYFNRQADPANAERFNQALASDRDVHMTYYCSFLKCQRRFRCYIHTPRPLNANAKPFVPASC